MSFFLDSLQRWLVMLALALAVLLGTTLGVRGDIRGATAEVAEAIDLEQVSVQTSTKTAPASIDPGGAAGDKLDAPHAVFAHTRPLLLADAGSEQPHEPVWRRPVLPQPERLLRPPDA